MKKFLLIFFSVLLLLGFKSNAQLTGVTNSPVSNITHEGATLNGNIQTSAAVDVDYQFNYSTTPGNLNLSSTLVENFNVNGTEAVNANLSGLTPETQYYFQLFAERSSDNTEDQLSGEGSFWTLATEPGDAGIPSFVSSDFDEISISFDAATDANGYLILYKEGGTPPAVTGVDDGAIGTGFGDADGFLYVQDDATTTRTVTIEGLTDQMEYSFRVIPFAHDGGDPIQEETYNYKTDGAATLSSVYTLSTIYQLAIDPFETGATTNASIQLNWTASSSTTTDGYLILYAEGSTAPVPTDPGVNIEKGVLPANQTFANKVVVTSDATETEIVSGLSSGTEYSFTIIPYNNDASETEATTNYNLTTYATVSAYTLADEPTTDPINPARDIPNVTEMSITYNAVGDAEGYLILYATGNNAPDATGVVDGTKSTDGSEFTDAEGYLYVQGSASTNPTISGLTEATEYSFRIIAFSHSADEPTTYNYKTPGVELISAYTLADQPTSPVINFLFDDNSTTSISFTFNSYTFPDNGGYVMYFKTGDAPENLTNLSNGDLPNGQIAGDNFVFETNDAATAISATGLNPGTQYSFILPIYNSDGTNEETFHYRKSDAPTATHWTLQTQPSDDIANLNYVSKTDGSITLSYDESTGANGYLILYRTGNNDPDGSGVTDGVVHADAGDFGQATGFQYVDGGSTLEAEITGLNPKTEYSFRIIPYSYATDGGIPVPETYNYNTASNTKREGVFTSATFPPDPVNGFIKASATTESVTFNWDDYTISSGFSDNGGFLLYYEEYLNADPIDLSTIDNGVEPASQIGLPSFIEITTDGDTEATVTGLDPATRYKFTIIPYNKDGSNNETIGYNITAKTDINHYTLQTPADGGADVVDDGTFNLAIVSNSEITVNWTAVTGASGYLVLYTKSNSALDDSFLENGVNPINQPYPTGAGEVFYTDVTDGSATTVSVTGLDADTDYAFKVIPYTYLNDGGIIEETYHYNNSTPPLRSGTTLCVDPTETVADLATSNVAVNQMDISWTNASGLNVLAVARLSTSTKTAPTDGQDYTANAAFSSGDQFGASGNYVVYEGTGTSFTLTGLDDYQEYSIDVYLFNDNGFCYENVGETVTETTLCDPAITEVNNTSITVNAFDEIALTWTIQGGGNVLILARESGSSAQAPSSNIDYNENSQFGSGQELGTGNFAVYDGNGTSTSITGLDENTAYSFDIYEYNPTRGGFCYNTTAVTLSETTVCEPPESEAVFNAPANVTAASVDLSWTAVTGADRYLIVAKEGSAVDLAVNNGDNFEDGGTGDIATSSFLAAADGDGTSGNKIVYANEGTSVTITELSGSTQYYFDIYAYKSGTYCYDFGSVSIDITTDPVEASNTLTLVGAASAISSVNNDNDDLANFITVMDFDMNDVGDDGADTKISGFTFTAGTGNDFASWNNILADAKVINTNNSTEFPATISVGSNQIEVTIGNSDNNNSTHFGFLADGGSINLELQIRLKKTISEEIDLKNLVFELDPANITIRSGSEFAPVPTITTSETDNEIEVLATAFEFTTDPPGTVNAGENVSPQAVVEAKDANGNLDLDYGTFTISNASAITMDNLPAPPSFTNGEFEFPATFNYQGSGDGTLTITDGANLFDVTSIPITVNPTVGLTELTTGLNAGTLQSSSTDQAVLGFEIATLGTSQVNEIVFTTDEDITGLVDNLRLVASPDNIYDGDESSITSTLNITGGTTITFSGLTEDFSSDSKNYFLILDVDDNVNIDLAPVTFQLDISDIVFTNSANKNASSFSRQYDFEDVTKPEITEITATPTLLSGADLGTDALEIKVTFNEKMDDAIIPDIDFPTLGEDPLFTSSLSGPNVNSGWSADSTFYTFYFDLDDQDELMENIDISISNAFDKYGNELNAVLDANLFSIDTENPVADNIALDLALVNRTDDTIELTVSFNKEMNGAIDPSFTVDNSINLIENGDGVWSLGNTVYTVTFTHDLGVEENITDKIIIEDAEDVAGNIMGISESDPFTINTTRARIDFITATNTTGIYKANDVITIEVHFDQNLTVDDGSGSPELDLNSNGVAVFDNAANNIMTFNYTVLATENAALLDVTGFRLEGATIKNAGLNDAILTLPADPADELSTRKEIEIDTQSPEITSTSITPNTVSRVNPTLTLIVNYNEVMDQTSTPSFLPSAANIILQSGGWSDNQTYRAEFEHDLTVEEEVANVTIEISDATDSVGNTTVTADSETFNIDTQHPRITEIVTTTGDGTYGPGEQVNIRVVFDEPIQQTGTAPTLTLNTGATADFDNITNGNQLNFTYTIGAANSGENTLDLDVTSISTSENEVLDLVDNPSVLTLPNANPNRLIDFADIVIDTRPAVITDVTSTSLEPKYKAGESIEIVVTFDEVVTVTNFPRIALNTGDYANYTGGSGSNELTFNYTVQDADGTTLFDVLDLEYADVNSLELNGGTIIDPASVPVDQTLPTIGSGTSLSDNTNIEIDTRDPEFTIDLDIVMVDLNDLTLTVTTNYDEDMDMSTDPAYSFSTPNNLVIDNVGNWSDNQTYVETFTHNGTEEELNGITIEISGTTDEVGNTAVTNTSDPFDIDTQNPRITQITSTSDGIYGPGEVIDIKVIFDEDVQQTGTAPTLNLNSTGVATFVDITNGNEVNFSYTVGAVNSGENTADLTVNSFSPSENEVLDLQANPSVLDLPGGNNLGDNDNIIIDTDPADITNVTANPTSGVFKAGDVIDIIITFNETVVVDETGGTPHLLLNTGSYAEYSSGSNSTELTFTYTVVSAGGSIVDVLDLEYANINSLELNGGAIIDLASVNANLVLPATAGAGSLSDNTDIEIDTTSPTVTIDLDNTVITRTNNQLVLTATYNEDMDQGTTPSLNVQGSNDLILDAANWNSATVYIATFTHNLTEEEVQNVTIEVSGATDVVGNTSITNTSETFTIDTQKPRITEIRSTSSNGLYSPGDNINIQLVFDEDVTVGGTPTLDLNSGGQATFQNVTNGNEVNFVYTVGGVNSGENTLDLDVTAFNMNGGNIRDLVSNDAEIILPSNPDRLQDNADIQVDSDPADIVNVTAIPDQGFFTAGDQIDITIEFDEPVVVTGTPLLSLNTGSNAEYVSGSNSTILTFNYTVEASNGTTIVDVAELEYVDINSIDLNSGTIEDLAGISASLGLPAVGSANSLNGNTDITIDTEDPELANDPFNPFNGEFNVSHSLNFTIEMNEPVSGQGTNNITIIDKKSSNVLVVLDGATAFTNNTNNILEFDSFENLLQDSTEYYIQFEPGALIDRAGNPFAGFTADNIWSFTTFGPPRIDDFSIGACVGETFTIQGQYFTGVSRIRTNIDGDTPFTITTFTVIDDETIEFTVPAGTVPGTITLDKQNGQAGNTESASTTSVDPIKVGPSSAQIVLVDSNDAAICDIDDFGNENEVEFTVDIVGGNGVYTLVYQVNDNDPITITAYESGQTFSVVPPDSAQNNVSIVSLTDEDPDLNTCSAPNLGSDVEVIKYIRSRVDAGGFVSDDSDIGVIELCGANTNIVDFSDLSLVTNSPEITGTVQQGTWTIDEGPSSNGGGFSPDFTLKSVQTDRPDTVKYYASFADGVRGEIVLKLTSDDPGGLNPCSGTNDLVAIRFVESISVNTERNIAICIEEDENGVQTAYADLVSTISGGAATDSLSAQWTRVDEFNEEAEHDSTWGFKDDENQANFLLTSNVPNPIYKASPLEIEEGRSSLEVIPVVVTGIGCGATPPPRQVIIRINDIPNPTKSSGPEIVCSGDQDIRFRMNPSSPGNTFQWNFTNGENEFDGATNSNLVFVNFREVEIAITDTLVVQEFNPSTGCISEPDTFFIALKPLPIANIKYNSTTTISNTAELIPLIGEGGSPGNLVDATPENGQFTGDGVIKSSNGNYFLDSSQLGVTDITDEEDVHEVIFTFFNEFGCSATDTIAFNVFDAERIFTGLNEEYCQLDPSFTIKVDPAIVPDGFEVSDITGPGISNVVFDETTQELTATFDPETAYEENGDQSSVFINYSIEDPDNPANNAENVGQQLVIVNPLPDMEIDPIESNLCSYDENIEFEPIGITGNNFSFKLMNEGLPDNLMIGDSLVGFEFNPRPLLDYLTAQNKDSIKIFVEYTYKDQNTCEDSRKYDFVVWRQPSKPALNSPDQCIINGVASRTTVENYVIGEGEEDNSDEELFWLPSQNFTTDEDIVLGTGTDFTPTESQLSPGNTTVFYVHRINVNSSGEQDASCVSTPTAVTYRRIQDPEFEFNKSTFGDEDIIFTGDPNQTDFESAEWTITKISDEVEELVLDEDITQINDTTISVDFNSYGAGRYRVNFNVSTTNSCSVDKMDEILILPEADVDDSYVYNFDGSTEGWVSSGFKGNESNIIDRLWDFAIPTGNSTFEADEPVWITNAEGSYESGITSYVYSPSMDIRNIDRPVVSFDLWTNMAQGDDGLILEYSTDGKVIGDSEKQWELLGNLSEGVSSGLQWYNQSNIQSLPGTNNIGVGINNPSFVGWSLENDAESIGSVNAKHSLEEIQDRENVIFRFQFKSRGNENEFGNRDGAAFDNFRIESLNRNVLIEYFGDFDDSGNLNLNDTLEMNTINKEFTATGNFAWINYRINENDPLYQQQSSSMLSRVYYYDAYELADHYAIDGEIRTETTFSQDDAGPNDLSRARLFSSIISRIDLDVSLISEDELGIDVSFESVEPIDGNVNLFIAVLQKEISGGAQGTNPDVIYYNVLRKLLPGNSGIAVSGSSGEHNVTFKANRESDEEPLAVVAFLQNVDNGQIIQSAYIDGFPELTLSNVTSVEKALGALDIKLYPNPAHDNLNIQWDIPLQEEAKAKVIDVTGKVIKDFRLEKGKRYYELNTSSMKTGMYNLILTNQKGEHKMMKFAVTN